MSHNLISSSNHVAISVDDEKYDQESPSTETLLMAQDYELPKLITQMLTSDIAQANAAAMISAFFAGALLTLVELVFTNGQGSSALARTLRWFSYSSVFSALASTFLCLTCVRMCSDLPTMAAQTILDNPNCMAARVARGEPIPIKIMRNRHELLRSFGGAKSYQAVDNAFNVVFMFGCICDFVTFILFIWYCEEDKVVTGPIMAIVVPAVICVIWSFRPASGFRNRFRRSRL